MDKVIKDCEISRAEFSSHMESWIHRNFRIDVMDRDGKPLIHVVKAELTALNPQTLSAEFLCDETKFSINLFAADRFTSDPAHEFEASLHAYSGEKLLASFLLYERA
jgi:hypothetical protein